MTTPAPDLISHPLADGSLRRLAEQEEFRSVCGFRRDLVGGDEGQPVRLHQMRIEDSTKHYHLRTWEYYYVVSGSGEIELDDETRTITAGDCVVVPPGVRHTSRPAAGEELHCLLIVAPAHADGAPDHGEDLHYD